MPTLDHTTIDEFRGRFHSFYDGLLRRVEIAYSEGGERSVTAIVAIRDATKTIDDGWVRVRLTMSRVQDFCFADAANTSAAVLSNGVHICWLDGILGLDFGHFVDRPDSLAELKTSKFYVTCYSLDWAVEPY